MGRRARGLVCGTMAHCLQALLVLLLCEAARGSQQARHTDAAVKDDQSGIIVNLFQQVQNNTRKAKRVGQKHMDKEIEILVDLMEKAKNYTMREDLMEKAKKLFNYSCWGPDQL